MATEMIGRNLKFPKEMHDKINVVAEQRGDNFSEATRYLIDRGLTLSVLDGNMDYIASIIREQLDVVLKPHVNRLAKIEAKTGISSATAMFLLVRVLQDFFVEIAPDRVKDPIRLYEKARSKAVEYLKNNIDDL